MRQLLDTILPHKERLACLPENSPKRHCTALLRIYALDGGILLARNKELVYRFKTIAERLKGSLTLQEHLKQEILIN